MTVPTVLRLDRRAPPLADGDRRRDAVDPVGVGLVELFEELAGVGREGLDVPPLALGIERVERQRTLARPADAGQDDQPVERQVEVDPLEVVDPDPSEPDASRRDGVNRPCSAPPRVARPVDGGNTAIR